MDIWAWLGTAVSWAANLIQIATAVFAIVVVYRARRRINALLRGTSMQHAGRHAALAVSIGEGSIKGQVEVALTEMQEKNPAVTEIPICEVNRTGHLTRGQMMHVMQEVIRNKQHLTDLGVTHVHLYYKGPVTLAAGIGALLDNWVPVTVYGLEKGQYMPMILLGKGAVFDLSEEILAEGQDTLIERVVDEA